DEHEERLPVLKQLRDAYVDGTVPDQTGKRVKIFPGAVSLEQGQLLFYLTRKLSPELTIETGFGYGMSASFILAAHKANAANGAHVSLDPHFRGWTDAVGLHT